jgi:hypothetical protein
MFKFILFLAFKSLQRSGTDNTEDPIEFKHLTDDDFSDIVNTGDRYLVLFRKKNECKPCDEIQDFLLSYDHWSLNYLCVVDM